MILHKYSPQVLEASSSDCPFQVCLFVCVLLFLRCSEHANYNDFVVSIQCIVQERRKRGGGAGGQLPSPCFLIFL